MIVSKDEARRILQGKKTAHRIPVKPGHDCPFVVGRDYAISTMAERDEAELFGFTSTVVATGRTRRRRQRVPRELCRIRVTAVAEARLGDMTVVDARAEGHRTTSDYHQHLESVRSITPDPGLRIWVLTFHVLRETDDKVRLLHAHSENGYTTDHRSALPEEPEAVDEATASRYARAAFERDDEQRRALPLELRLARARAEADAKRIDISAHTRVIEQRLERIERSVNPDTEAAA